MTDSNERVRISYTVEMGEVPSRIAILLREAASDIARISNQLDEIANNLEQEGNVHTLHNSVDDSRRSLMRADLRLEDVYALLGSYQRALVEFKEQKNLQGGFQSDEAEVEEND